MPDFPFSDFSDEARLWIYVAGRSLSEREQEALLHELDSFFDNWTSHGRAVRGAAALLDDRLLLVTGAVSDADLSGCGIDASVNVIEEAGSRLDASWVSPINVAYRDAEGRLQTASRSAFRKLAARDEVDGGTPVFDLSLDTVGALRQGALEQPAADAWHARAFDLSQPTTSA